MTYIDSITSRIDFVGTGQSSSLISVIGYIINDKGIKTGSFGFSNIDFTDRVSGTPAWGYIEFAKHGDNYVTVKYYPETIANGFYIAQFILGQTAWAVDWKKVQYAI